MKGQLRFKKRSTVITMKYRPVAVPLVTVNPFFSIWSCDDALYGGPTQHWSGKICPITAGILVGGEFVSMGAFEPNGRAIKRRAYQTDLRRHHPKRRISCKFHRSLSGLFRTLINFHSKEACSRRTLYHRIR